MVCPMAKDQAPEVNAGELERIRVDAGLTRSMLAEKALTKYKTIHNLETGWNRRFSRELRKRLADALGVEPEQLTLQRVAA